MELNTTKIKSGKGRAAKTKWKCKLCGKQFSKRHTTFDHMQTVHGEELNDFLDSRLGEDTSDEDVPPASARRSAAGAAPRAGVWQAVQLGYLAIPFIGLHCVFVDSGGSKGSLHRPRRRKAALSPTPT